MSYAAYELEPQDQGYIVYAWHGEQDGPDRDEFAFSDIIAATQFIIELETGDEGDARSDTTGEANGHYTPAAALQPDR